MQDRSLGFKTNFEVKTFVRTPFRDEPPFSFLELFYKSMVKGEVVGQSGFEMMIVLVSYKF
jgi:hypothetical protein